MGGLGTHYSNTAQKMVTGHCLFSGLYVLLGQRCPLGASMYCQRSVCAEEGQPFQSKVEMAVEQIEQFEPVAGTKTHVLIDSWYHCRQVRRAAQKRGWAVSGALKSNRWMRRIEPDGSRHWRKLADYAATLSRDEWCEIVWPSQEGEQRLYAHLVPTWVRKLGPTLLLITCHDLDAPPKTRRFWGSTMLELEAQALVDILAIRWQVETFFEYDKDLLGSDHYQVMSRQAVLRFWTLTACLLYFLEMQRTATSLTCGDVRRHIQQVHRRNLLAWLAARWQDGLSIDQIALQLAL
jgi:SRSO17 transposase